MTGRSTDLGDLPTDSFEPIVPAHNGHGDEGHGYEPNRHVDGANGSLDEGSRHSGVEDAETEQVERIAPDEPARPSILDQLGGVSGMVASTIPVVVFVGVNAISSLIPAVIAAVAVALGIAVWRLVRHEPLQPAVSGLLGVGVGAFVAYRTGAAKGYFLVGIWYSALLCVVFLVSVLARWPLAGVIWHGINGDGQGWRSQRKLVRAYDLATLLWAAVFAGRFVVQHWLYNSDQTGWLAVTKILMGLPLAGLALLGTLWAVRRASHTTGENDHTSAEARHTSTAGHTSAEE